MKKTLKELNEQRQKKLLAQQAQKVAEKPDQVKRHPSRVDEVLHFIFVFSFAAMYLVILGGLCYGWWELSTWKKSIYVDFYFLHMEITKNNFLFFYVVTGCSFYFWLSSIETAFFKRYDDTFY